MHVPDLKLRRIDVVTPRHAENAENELRKERHVEAEEDQDRRARAPSIPDTCRPVIFGHQ